MEKILENRPIQSKKRYLLAFLIGTIIFIFVFLLSYYLSYLEFQRISIFQTETAYSIFEDKLVYGFFDKGFCSNQAIQEISDDLRFQGKIIDDLERKLGKNNKDVLLRKKFYTLIELEHFEFVNLIKDNCNYDINTILFFYSNEDRYLSESEELGRLLGAVYSKNTKNLIIYSFDINLDSNLIETLNKKYEITEPLSLIINGEDKIVDPKSLSDIEKYLN